MKKYHAILFDMDGVIVDSMRVHAEAWIEVFSEFGLALSTEDIYRREGMSGLDSIIDIFLEKKYPVPSRDDLVRLQEKKHALFERHRIHVFPGVKEILELLDGRAIPMGLVTGSLRRSVAHVLPADVESFFKIIVTVEDISRGKPHPEPYLRALEKLGFEGREALAIENAPHGIASAKAAGLACYALETTLKKQHLGDADIVFPDHRSLLAYLISHPGA